MVEVGNRTIQGRSVLRNALQQAVRWRMLPENPARSVDLPRWEKREMQALTPAEVARFREAAASDPWAVFFDFALATGMRPGEILALRWEDLDLDAGTVTVRRALVGAGSRSRFAEPKTPKSRRTIPLPGSLIHALAAHKRRQAVHRLKLGPEYEDQDLVFASATGGPHDARNLADRHLKPILRRAKLPGSFRLYDLRHTCATLLLAAGVHPKVVSERLGHAGITLTLDTYAHVLPGMQRKAADRLEAILFGGG